VTVVKSIYPPVTLKESFPMRAQRLHYAWIILFVTFAGLLSSAGVRNAPGVIMKSLEGELGWARTDISFAVAISLFIFGFGAPLGGMILTRFGPRRMMLGGLTLITIGLAAMTQMGELWQFHLWWGVLVGLGTGAISGTLGATVATRWFNKHRSIVLGIFSAAAAAGQFIFLPSLITVNSAAGWRAVIWTLAGVCAIGAAVILLFMRDKPEDIQISAYGEPTAAAALADSRFTPMREALKTRDFWLLAASFFVCGYTTNGMIGTHLLPHAIEHGFVEAEMSWALALMGIMNIIGSLISGYLCERYDNRTLLAAYYGFRGLSLMALPFILEMQGMFIFAVIYGFDWVATVPPTVNLTAQRFGRKSLATIYGWIYFSHMLGAGIASFAGGFFRDRLGDYHLVFISAAIMGIVATGLTLSVSRKAIPPRVKAVAAVGD
jgi:sugar phosphate permease